MPHLSGYCLWYAHTGRFCNGTFWWSFLFLNNNSEQSRLALLYLGTFIVPMFPSSTSQRVDPSSLWFQSISWWSKQIMKMKLRITLGSIVRRILIQTIRESFNLRVWGSTIINLLRIGRASILQTLSFTNPLSFNKERLERTLHPRMISIRWIQMERRGFWMRSNPIWMSERLFPLPYESDIDHGLWSQNRLQSKQAHSELLEWLTHDTTMVTK